MKISKLLPYQAHTLRLSVESQPQQSFFAREVETRTKSDPRVKEAQQLAQFDGTQKAALQVKLKEISATVQAEKMGEVASEFDYIHNVQRALLVGSIDHVIEPETIRPYLIEALERGIDRELRRITG